MLTWVLIIVLAQINGLGGMAVTTQEFSNKDTCEYAVQRLQQFQQSALTAFCVHK